MPHLDPTTKAQVSGHKFLKRRVEHGLVLGDIRMIHDPMARRRRALLFGAAGAALTGVGAGALALFSPNANPGDAAIIAAESGQLFVRVEDAYHPVSNLASARLVSGSPESPAKASDGILAEMPKSIPVGIVDAPSIIVDQSSLPDIAWLVCHEEATRVSRLDTTPDSVVFIADDVGVEKQLARSNPTARTALLTKTDNNGLITQHVVTAEGRMQLPPEDSPEGRIVRRHLGITAQTPLWEPPLQVVNAVAEQPAVALPPRDARIWEAPNGSWLFMDGKIHKLSSLQRQILEDAGFGVDRVTNEQVSTTPDHASTLRLPDKELEFVDPSLAPVCVTERGTIATVDTKRLDTPLELGGESVATHFIGPGKTMAVNTGSGTHVISETGLRHHVPTKEDQEALGLDTAQDVPWLLVSLLPEGTVLTRDEAVKALY